MTHIQQPEALRLAHALSGGKMIDDSTEWADTLHAAAAELHHLQARNEQLENFSCDYGFAGVLNEAIDAAMAAQARNKKGIEQ